MHGISNKAHKTANISALYCSFLNVCSLDYLWNSIKENRGKWALSRFCVLMLILGTVIQWNLFFRFGFCHVAAKFSITICSKADVRNNMHKYLFPKKLILTPKMILES